MRDGRAFTLRMGWLGFFGGGVVDMDQLLTFFKYAGMEGDE